jgi:putative oxidoreductase
MNALFIIGSVLFAFLFFGAGIGHFKASEAMTGYAKYKGLPAPKAGVLVSGALFLVGAIAVAVAAIAQGDFVVYGFFGALAIALVMFPTAVIFHNFWKETDPQAKQNEQIQFNKDIALAGAALVIAFVFAVLNDPTILS